MARYGILVARDPLDSETPAPSSNFFNSNLLNLLVALLALATLGLTLVGLLFLLRKKRLARQAALLPTHSQSSNHRRLTIMATPYSGRSQSVYVYNEKRDLIENSDSPPPSPVPEIRITFPDEEDQQGKRKSGKVVVVRIGDSGSIGMEPVGEDKLPPYQSSDAERFQSLDLERMGGLTEKEPKHWA